MTMAEFIQTVELNKYDRNFIHCEGIKCKHCIIENQCTKEGDVNEQIDVAIKKYLEKKKKIIIWKKLVKGK